MAVESLDEMCCETDALLSLEDLQVQFRSPRGIVHAVRGVSFSVNRGETLGIVGESGCGKSVTASSILRLIAEPPGRIVAGSIKFDGTDLLKLTEREMRAIRGNEISMIFQEPMTSLNPLLTIGRQIGEPLEIHRGLSRREALDRAVEMLRLVQIPEPEKNARKFPHQLSGGMRQRVMIAMAMSCDPQILIADEPTTALDVTIQAQVLDLMRDLQDRLGTAIVLITHDMGVVAENAQRVVVMYAGKKVEEAETQRLFSNPCHPYTKGLLNSIPKLDEGDGAGEHQERLQEIPGMVPQLVHVPAGCLFEKRCAYATDRCRREVPPFEEKNPGQWAACWNTDKFAEKEP